VQNTSFIPFPQVTLVTKNPLQSALQHYTDKHQSSYNQAREDNSSKYYIFQAAQISSDKYKKSPAATQLGFIYISDSPLKT
jgi:hypothetical protein